MNESQFEIIRAMPGLLIHEQSPEEKREWMAAFDPVYDQFASVIGRDLLDRVRELQRKYDK